MGGGEKEVGSVWGFLLIEKCYLKNTVVTECSLLLSV
jgi:hypothetical protein